MTADRALARLFALTSFFSVHAREQEIDISPSESDFVRLHIGPNENETAEMLRAV